MMKPTFDDVIEYVRAGEDDPELEKLLDVHPDGKELLKQARFICRMLERELGEGKGKSGPAVAALAASYDRMAEPSELSLESVGETFGIAKRRSRTSRIGRDERGVEDLGTLEFAFEAERVSLSYEPTEQMQILSQKFLARFKLPQVQVGALRIFGTTVQLSLPESVPVGAPLTVHLSHGARQMPASGQEMIFMPETGPFLKLEADGEGRIDMPVPEVPGTLRIDTAITELLRIRLKN